MIVNPDTADVRLFRKGIGKVGVVFRVLKGGGVVRYLGILVVVNSAGKEGVGAGDTVC